jgi:hypothetical protein
MSTLGAELTGTIAGVVKWSGPLPRIPTFTINKDPETCDPESHKTRDLERLIAGPLGGVANTVVFLRNISRGKAMDLPEPRHFLDQKYCRYGPHILLVPQSAVLHMKSSDATLHTVHMDGAATYNLPFPFTNQIISRPMPTAGLVNMRCNAGQREIQPLIQKAGLRETDRAGCASAEPEPDRSDLGFKKANGRCCRNGHANLFGIVQATRNRVLNPD